MIKSASRFENFSAISLTAINTPFNLPTNGGQLPPERFMEGLMLEFQGRITNAATAPPTGVMADAPYSIIDRVTLQGYHVGRGATEMFINLRGAEIRALNRLYDNTRGIATISNINGSNFPADNPANWDLSAGGYNDIRFFLYIPFTPLLVARSERNNWLLDVPNYQNLVLTVYYADDMSVLTGQTQANGQTFTAFGQTTGSPSIQVGADFAISATRFKNFAPGRVWRYFFETTSGDIASGNTVTASRLFNLPKGWLLRALLLKEGVKNTATTAGNSAYTSLSDTISTNIQVQMGINKLIRKWGDMYTVQNLVARKYGQFAPLSGYALLDFCMNGTLGEALNTANLIAGSTGDTDLFLQSDLAGLAGQAAVLVVEELRNVPGQVNRV